MGQQKSVKKSQNEKSGFPIQHKKKEIRRKNGTLWMVP